MNQSAGAAAIGECQRVRHCGLWLGDINKAAGHGEGADSWTDSDSYASSGIVCNGPGKSDHLITATVTKSESATFHLSVEPPPLITQESAVNASLLSAAKKRRGRRNVFAAPPLELQRKATAFDVFDAGRIETFDGTALDELGHEVVKTLNPIELAKSVCSVIHHDVQTIR